MNRNADYVIGLNGAITKIKADIMSLVWHYDSIRPNLFEELVIAVAYNPIRGSVPLSKGR